MKLNVQFGSVIMGKKTEMEVEEALAITLFITAIYQMRHVT